MTELLKIMQRNTIKGGVVLLLLVYSITGNSQKLDYKCYQVGNDYPGSPVWVPHNVADIFVTPDGTLYTNVKWEENGANVTEVNPDGTITRGMRVGNHGGGNAVTANESHIYFAGNKHRTGNQGIDRRDRSTLSEASNLHVDCGKVYGLALSTDRVYASVRDENVIKVFGLDLQEYPDENITINGPEDLFFDSEGMLWVLLAAEKKVVKIDPQTRSVQDELVLEASVIPEDIAIDNQDRMFVTDISEKEQVRIYQNITTEPVFEKTFGHAGGVMSGTPGIYEPLKFDMPVGVGVDQNGNIYVANRVGTKNGSTLIQKYTPAGDMLWDLMDVVWIDMMQPVPGNENVVYSSREKMKIDYAAQEWELLATTINKHQYPDDYRLTGDNHTGATWIRNLHGQNFMFLTNMPGTRVDIYKFDGEITVPTGYVAEDRFWFDVNGDGQVSSGEVKSNSTGSTRGFWVDINGDIWQASRDNGIFKYSLEGLDANQALKYSLNSREKFPMPEPFTELRRIRFYPEKNNLMVINGFTTGELSNINHHWKRAGKVFSAYENWNGQFGNYDWQIIPPYEDEAGGNHGDGNIQTFEVVDDYVFFAREGSSSGLGIARGTVEVYKKDGTYIGYMTPTEEMGNIGILDITEAMVVYKLSWGPYIIGIEDDGKAKIVVYEWCPEGDCIPSDMEVQLMQPMDDTVYTYNNVLLETNVSTDTSTIEKVEFYANNALLGSATGSPWSFTLPDTSLGSVALRARVIADNAAYKWSNEVFLTVSNGDPRVSITEPVMNTSVNIFDTIQISADAFDYDGTIDSIEFYSEEEYIGASSTSPFQVQWELNEAGEFGITAKAYDDSGRIGLSEPVSVTAYGYRTAESPENVINGVIYEYYKGSWQQLPDFSSLFSKKKDTLSNFEISQHDGTDEFAYLFSAYIDIREKGRYTFYTTSDDGSQLYIGDRLIVDNDGTHGPQEESGAILMDTGLHKIQVSMFEAYGGESLEVEYEGPGISRQTIPDTVLYRSRGTAPEISISKPANDTIFNIRDVIHFKTSVYDEDEDVSRIELYTGNYLLGEFTDTAFVLEVNNLAEGTHIITAKAYDLGGAVSVSDPLTITINAAPEIFVTSPEDQSEYTRSETINIDFSVEDTSLEKVEIYVNNNLVKTFSSAPFQYELSDLERGTYFIKIVAIDNYKLEASERIEIMVVNSVPDISIIEPAEGDTFRLGEDITFKAALIDEDEDVYKVAFYNQEGQIGSNANIFNETTVRNLPLGNHSIVAKAFDRPGAVAESDTMRITVTHPSSVNNKNVTDVITVYPNPLKDGDLTVKLNENLISGSILQISVTDITGKIVYEFSVNGLSSVIDIPYEKFPGEGLYFISLQNAETRLVTKVTIK